MTSKNFQFFAAFLVSFLIAYTGQAQEFKRLLSSGEIPSDFITASSEKVKIDLEKIGNKDRKDEVEDYYLYTNFELDNMLQSGTVIFNDSLSNYVQRVANVLLKDQPELLKQLRFYTLRTSAVNAFATNRGLVFVTVGLISKLENEAQLAFILAHEISHVIKKHNFKLYLEHERLRKDQESAFFTRRKSFYDLIFERNKYSRALELEADAEGYKLFRHSPYHPEALNQTFDLLARSQLPFEEWKFRPQLLESEYISFPDSFQLAQVDTIKLEEDYDDSEITHPNIEKRRANVKNLIAQDSSTLEQKIFYVLGEPAFQQIQQIARQQLPDLQLRDFDYPLAIYNSMLLHDKGIIDEHYYKKALSQALYGLVKIANSGNWYRLIDYYGDIAGERQQLYYLLSKLSHQDLNILALSHLWQAQQKFPADPQLNYLLKALLKEWVEHYGEELSSFEQAVFVEEDKQLDEEIDLEEFVDTLRLDNTESLVLDSLEQAKDSIVLDSLMQYDLSDMVGNDLFVQLFEDSKQEVKQKTKESLNFSGLLEELKQAGQSVRKGQSLDIDSLVVINPYYMSVKLFDLSGADYAKEFVKSEKFQGQFKTLINEMADRQNVNLKTLDVKELAATNTDLFNDLIQLNDWINQIIEFDDLNHLYPHNHEAILELADKYGTDYFLWIGMVNTKLEALSAFGVLVRTLLNPLFGVEKVFFNGKSLLYAWVVNVRTGEVLLTKYNQINMPKNKGIISTHLYDLFAQIRGKQ